jgi:hypothetical protein
VRTLRTFAGGAAAVLATLARPARSRSAAISATVDGMQGAAPVTVLPTAPLTFASLSAGYDFTCWGGNWSGELGDGSGLNQNAPVPVAGGLTFASITAGASRTCGLTTARVAYCWGANPSGQLGDGSVTDRRTPVRVAGQP